MTCVVAYAKDGEVCMGGDSAAVDATSIVSRTDPKVFRKNEIVMGWCHSFRLGQILQYRFRPPKLPVERTYETLMEYMVTEFVPALRDTLDANIYPYHEDEKAGWTVLVGISGFIFYVENDFHVGHDRMPYMAIGSGAPYAFGSLFSTSPDVGYKTAFDHVEQALLAAAKFSPTVSGPFSYEVV